MSNLGDFRKDAKERPSTGSARTTSAARSGPKGPPDMDRCPAGWDVDIWYLTLQFEKYARADGITLKAGRPIIYAELVSLVDQCKVRSGKYNQEVRGCAKRRLHPSLAARCWYHWPADPDRQEARALTWVEMVEVIMLEFWSRVQNDQALDYFRRYFTEYGRAAVKHWRGLRISLEIDERAKDAPRPPMVRRRNPGDSMTPSVKEG